MPRSTDGYRDRRDKKEGRDGKGGRKTFSNRRRACKFCVDKRLKIDYKEGKSIQSYVSERGKIIARRYTGACAKHQRDITLAIKRARILALIPFTSTQVRDYL